MKNPEIIKIVLDINDEYLAKAQKKKEQYFQEVAKLRQQGYSKQERDEMIGYSLETIKNYIEKCLKLKRCKDLPDILEDHDVERIQEVGLKEHLRHLYQLNQFYV